MSLWDDDALLLANPAVMSPSIDAVKLAWQEPHEHLYVPLTYNLWFVVARVASLLTHGSTPAAGWFHAASIAVHIMNALLVYALLRQLHVLRSAAVIGTMAFALHPLQVEAVAWCSAMKDLLSTCLALLCMLCHVWGDERYVFDQARNARTAACSTAIHDYGNSRQTWGS